MYVEVDKIKFYYEEFGHGLPIILFSGFATDSKFMQNGFEPIFQNYNDSLKRKYVDHPGVGLTEYANDVGINMILNILLEIQ
ncbi:alpha/beta fold hydrolase [Aquibacillus kalidii]|uniref:alpha/beta fold hydrolase n=1 Tax=Aquibacillus kalidii TaxID=2762597 RepID=UPI00164618F0|nr:hypothetical protein [Aquibacillus kalidii]